MDLYYMFQQYMSRIVCHLVLISQEKARSDFYLCSWKCDLLSMMRMLKLQQSLHVRCGMSPTQIYPVSCNEDKHRHSKTKIIAKASSLCSSRSIAHQLNLNLVKAVSIRHTKFLNNSTDRLGLGCLWPLIFHVIKHSKNAEFQ